MFVTDRDRFLSLCEAIRAEGTFAWDTEFIQDRTYWPRLCLVQVATRGEVAAIDPFEVGDLEPLWDLVTDPAVRVVLHAGAQDLQIAFDAAERPARNIFDTQIAAAFLGYGDSISYAGLLSKELGVRLSKRETMTDWSRRPLTEGQLEYALDDVRHLLTLYDRLNSRLEELGRSEWIREELAPYEDPENFRRDPRNAWVRLSKRKSLDKKALAVLREVAAWREETAAQRNVPRNRVLGDEMLVEIAKRAPREVQGLSAIRNLPERIVAQAGKEIVSRVKEGLAIPPTERPEPPPLRSEDPARARVVDIMDLFVQVRARETGVARNVLATRLDLDRAAGLHYGERDGHDAPRVLRGWRAKLVGDDLRRLLEGGIVLGVDPKTRLPRVMEAEAGG
ncbi:MAG: ribonuclease D [bacterium]